MWVSFWNRGLYRLDRRYLDTTWGASRPFDAEGVYRVYGSLGRIWFGSRNNVLAVLEGDRVQTFGSSDGVHVGDITAIYGRGSEIWVGGEFGLQRFDHGRFHSISAVIRNATRNLGYRGDCKRRPLAEWTGRDLSCPPGRNHRSAQELRLSGQRRALWQTRRTTGIGAADSTAPHRDRGHGWTAVVHRK